MASSVGVECFAAWRTKDGSASDVVFAPRIEVAIKASLKWRGRSCFASNCVISSRFPHNPSFARPIQICRLGVNLSEPGRCRADPCSNSASLLASTAFHFIRLTEVKLQRAIQEWGCRVAADGSLTFPFLNFGNMPFATAEFVVVNLTTQVEYQLCEGENFQRQFQWFAPQNEDVYMRVSQLVKRPGI